MADKTSNGKYEKIVAKIERQSTYKKLPTAEKKYMTVSEMGRLLGLKKTDRYWLVHKNFFVTKMIMGKMRVDLESFEKWYANQVKYHKVTGEEPGLELKQQSYSAGDIAEILQISKNEAYQIMKRDHVPYILVDFCRRIPKEEFDKWYANQDKYRNETDRKPIEEQLSGTMTMPEMARLLGVHRHVVYALLEKHSDILETITVDNRRRVVTESFYKWYRSQSVYQIAAHKEVDEVAQERNSQIAALRSEILNREGNARNIGNEDYLTIREAALLADTPTSAVSRWIAKEKFPVLRSGRVVRIPRQTYEQWLFT